MNVQRMELTTLLFCNPISALMIIPALVIMESEKRYYRVIKQDALISTSEHCILIFELIEFPIKYFEFSWGNVVM